jgi:hypothetical protein
MADNTPQRVVATIKQRREGGRVAQIIKINRESGNPGKARQSENRVARISKITRESGNSDKGDSRVIWIS